MARSDRAIRLMKASGRVADAGNISVTLTKAESSARSGQVTSAPRQDRVPGAARYAPAPGPRSCI